MVRYIDGITSLHPQCTTLKVVESVLPTKPQVFSTCWGTSVPVNCGNSPPQPPVISGTSFTIKADIYNTGPTGKVRCVFKDGSTVISDQNNSSLPPFPAVWSPSFTWSMPSRNVSLVVEAYGWNGTTWILNHTVTSTISRTTPTCTDINISYTGSTNIIAGDKVTFTATVTPNTQPFIVNFKLRDGTTIGSCGTSTGTCIITWDTTGKTSGTYYIHGEVTGQCTSTEAYVNISVPILQHNIGITIKDLNTNNPIVGANVTVSTQTLVTDTNGFVIFRVNDGTIDISVSKSGYNTYTTVVSIYQDISTTYWIIPVTPTTGNLRFITVPTASNVYINNVFVSISDISTGVYIAQNLTAGSTNYTVSKAGYNTANGTTIIVGGVTTDVPVTLTPITPTTGSVCIKSTPSGANIYMNNAPTGKTTALSVGGCVSYNTIDNLAPGSYNCKLLLIGYLDKPITFTITAGQTTIIDAGNLTAAPTFGTLSILSNPPGARVYIDDMDTQYITPATILNISTGIHTYKLSLSGYQDKTNTFTITSGQTTTVDAGNLTAIPVGILSILSIPSGAEVFVDNIDTQHVTPAVINIPTGSHTYRLSLGGYQDKNDTFTIAAGQTTTVVATLEAGGGAGVGGVVVTVIGIGLLYLISKSRK